jgi:multidrug transporter EmrE-like cation transporter
MLQLTPKTIFFSILIIAILLEVAGDVFFKKWSLSSRSAMLVIGAILYFAGSIFWAISLKYETLSKAGTIFMIANFVLIALVGVLYFKEDLSLTNKLGIALGALSIILIEF